MPATGGGGASRSGFVQPAGETTVLYHASDSLLVHRRGFRQLSYELCRGLIRETDG